MDKAGLPVAFATCGCRVWVVGRRIRRGVRYSVVLDIVALALVGLLQVLGGFFLRALRIVAGADGLVVFVHSTFALAGDIEDLSEIDVRPDLGPFRIEISVQRFAE